jgi:microcystin-dependent protein
MLGQRGGTEKNTLAPVQMPAHTHLLNASNLPADQAAPTGNVLAAETLYHTIPTNTALSAAAIGMAGGGQSIDNHQPYLPITYIIAWQGIYPQRP